jgi:hypothetical protein
MLDSPLDITTLNLYHNYLVIFFTLAAPDSWAELSFDHENLEAALGDLAGGLFNNLTVVATNSNIPDATASLFAAFYMALHQNSL